MRTASRTWPALLAAILLIAIAIVVGAGLIAALTSSGGCNGATAPAGPPSAQAKRDVPADFLSLYEAAGAKYAIPWQVLAGIGREECDHGRNPDPSCTPQPGASGGGAANSAGAAGPMQIGIGGAAGDTFSARGVDADADAKTGAHDPADAIATAAVILLKDKGAKPGQPIDAYRDAARAYNGSGPQAEAYADRVIADAHTYATGANAVADAAPSGACGDAGLISGGVPGKVIIAPSANRPGASLQKVLVDYVAQMAGLYGNALTITTGTNHDQYTVDGNVSDHWDGHGADLGMAANNGTDDGPVGDRIMTACLLLAGEPAARAAAQAQRGGLYTLTAKGLRVQCIWKTDQGGNHHNHVHVGVQPEG